MPKKKCWAKESLVRPKSIFHFAEKHPKVADAWNRTLLDALRVGVILIDPETQRIVDVNAFAANMLKRDRNDLIGHACHDRICGAEKDLCPIHNPNQLGDATESCLLRSDGERIPIHKSVTLVIHEGKNLLLANFVDVSEQKKSQKKAQHAEAKIGSILRSVADGLVFTDRKNRIVLMSASAETLLDKRVKSVLLQPLETAIDDKNLAAEITAIQAGEKEEALVEIVLKNEGSRKRIIQAKPAIVKDNDKNPTGVITLLRDISQERKLERLKSEFIATAAHELRTPLTAIMGFSELLLNEHTFNEDQKTEFLSIIHDKAEVLSKIINDFLSLERVDSGELVLLNKDWADVESIVRRCTQDFQRTYPEHHFEVVSKKSPIMAFVDDRKLFQLLENLISNAVKFSSAGSRIKVFCEALETEVRISVCDEGVGMSPGEMERIFDKFYRIDASDTAVEGIGLGMAIAKSIVEAHGGQIGVESDPGKGTTVTFNLPTNDETAKPQNL